MKAFVYTLEDYGNLLYNVSENNVGINYDADGWFYIVDEDYYDDVTDEDVYSWLGKELNVIVTDVIIDTNKEKVAIICT